MCQLYALGGITPWSNLSRIQNDLWSLKWFGSYRRPRDVSLVLCWWIGEWTPGRSSSDRFVTPSKSNTLNFDVKGLSTGILSTVQMSGTIGQYSLKIDKLIQRTFQDFVLHIRPSYHHQQRKTIWCQQASVEFCFQFLGFLDLA